MANEALDNYDTIDNVHDDNYERIDDAEEFFETNDTYEDIDDVTAPKAGIKQTDYNVEIPSLTK